LVCISLESASIVEGLGVCVNAFGWRDDEARLAVVDREWSEFGEELLVTSCQQTGTNKRKSRSQELKETREGQHTYPLQRSSSRNSKRVEDILMAVYDPE